MVMAGRTLSFLVVVVLCLFPCTARRGSANMGRRKVIRILIPQPTPAPIEKTERILGDWMLVFRARSGIGGSVVDAYSTSNGIDELNSDPGCTSVNGTDYCRGHYRNSIIDRWASTGIKRVIVVLYEDGTPVAFVKFDAIGADMYNWFDRSRVVSSSWTDIRIEGNYFSIFGLRDENVNRRFYINKKIAGCQYDVGWMAVIEANGVCGFDQHDAYPVFRYSKHSTQSTPYRYFGEADVFAIYVSDIEG